MSSKSKPRTTKNSQRAAQSAAEVVATVTEAQSKPITLNWLFFDHERNPKLRAYFIDISKSAFARPLSALRADLMKELPAEHKFQADPATISFYTPKKPLLAIDMDEDWVKSVANLHDVATSRQPVLVIEDLLGNSEDLDRRALHLIITADEEIAVETENETVPAMDNISRFERHKIRAAGTKAASSAAKSREFLSKQKSTKTVIHDGYYAASKNAPDPTAPPLRIFHPVFDSFLNKLADAAFEPSDEIAKSVSDLMKLAAKIVPSEPRVNSELRKSLSIVLGRPIQQVMQDNGQTADGVMLVYVGNTAVPILVLENKRQLGEGGCDPLIQGEYSALHMFANDELKPVANKCCCPTFIIGGGGPYLGVLGAVMTNHFIVQRLTDLLWLGDAKVYEDAHVFEVARVFMALRECLNDLEAYYKALEIPVPSVVEPAGSFPYPTEYTTADGQVVKFCYVSCLEEDAQCVTFLAETGDEQKTRVVVKFVDRYGAEQHRLLAEHQMAPKLLYLGSLDGKVRADDSVCGLKRGLYVGKIRMVVMGYVEGKTAHAKARSEWPADAVVQIQAALKVLHDNGHVFGDLRQPNVMFNSDDKVQLIDFNWAGKFGEAKYPRNLSTEITWADGVTEFALITQDHDKAMVNLEFA